MRRRDVLAAVDSSWRSPRDLLIRIKTNGWVGPVDAGADYRSRISIVLHLKPMHIQGIVERRRVGQVFEWRCASTSGTSGEEE